MWMTVRLVTQCDSSAVFYDFHLYKQDDFRCDNKLRDGIHPVFKNHFVISRKMSLKNNFHFAITDYILNFYFDLVSHFLWPFFLLSPCKISIMHNCTWLMTVVKKRILETFIAAHKRRRGKKKKFEVQSANIYLLMSVQLKGY